jgi:uroporphyrin-III C-methyltransferase/precorrin-2 dehydrogenase/sirohydrochlorin ferrochelatase
MAFRYPITLDLEGRPCVVIGGGPETETKVRGLLAAGARVRVFARDLSGGLRHLDEEGAVELIERPYVYGDLTGAFLAIGASGDTRINALARREADENNVLFNAVDDVDNCHFAAPAVVRRGDFLLTISTGGKAPALAKRLRKELSQQFGDEYGVLVDALGEVRAASLPRRVDFPTWAARWDRAVSDDVLELVRNGCVERAKARVRRELKGSSERSGSGRVAIVGAGPGDPGLITVKGKHLVDRADVVVYDRLVHPALVEGKNAIFVGKRAGRHYVPQKELNELLISLAKGGQEVVRLKGGDPFVFGRGGEEVEALSTAGIDVEVVSAPTSAIAALASAGIPVTDRRAGSSVALVTGHCTKSEVDWRGLARSADTIVVLMGVANIRTIVAELVAGGRDAYEAAAVVENGTLPEQRVFRAPLGRLPDEVDRHSVRSPAVIVTGEVVDLGTRAAGVDGARPRCVRDECESIAASLSQGAI